MTKTYPLLPHGPVVCRACAKTGNRVEMEQDELDITYLGDKVPDGHGELQSYRCPECENIVVFRVT